ncbi:MAG: hypothetical protein DRI70_02260 [Bacteroidetes bacterium]|nr:MAG: hypothetical protein DRI70_02260 [Bacteroidota bacterium]
MEDFNSEKYDRALKRVKDIKGFYSHLVVYIIVNLLLMLAHLGIFTHGFVHINLSSWSYFTTPFFWGIGLFFHGLFVFQHKFRFFKDWEERKIKEFMEKDEEEYKNTTKWD